MKKKGILLLVSILLIIFGVSVFFSASVPIDEHNQSAKKASSGKVVGETFSPKIVNQSNGDDSSDISVDEDNLVLVTKVIDGDTIEVAGGIRVRYIGIDTPETVDPRKPVQCFGREASDKNKKLVEGKKVRLEKDVSDADKYGRLLRYIWVPSKEASTELSRMSSGQVLVNEILVKEGYAYSSPYPPDVKHQERLDKAQRFAQNNNKGLWRACNVVDVQKDITQSQTQSQSGSCQIKGNLSSSGDRIYHLPGQRYYGRTVIDESKGERWFCSEKEAQDYGWRKSKV